MLMHTIAVAWLLLLAPVSVPDAAPAASGSYGPAAELTLRVTPRVLLEHQDARATVVLDRAAAHRRLIIDVEAGEFYSSSERALAGEDAPRVHEFPLHTLPAGEYVVVVRVVDAYGHEQVAKERFSVRRTDYIIADPNGLR
jgi:hypothetical protein